MCFVFKIDYDNTYCVLFRCISLTTGTYILGLFSLLNTISSALYSYWASFTLRLICTLLFTMVLVNPSNASTR